MSGEAYEGKQAIPVERFQRNIEAEKAMNIDAALQAVFPADFFDNPTMWIERQPEIDRSEELRLEPGVDRTSYDFSRVRVIEGKEKRYVVKRLDKANAVNEPGRARAAYDADIPTPRMMGTVEHWGNRYVFFEMIERRVNLNEAERKVQNFVDCIDSIFTIPLIKEKELRQDREDWDNLMFYCDDDTADFVREGLEQSRGPRGRKEFWWRMKTILEDIDVYLKVRSENPYQEVRFRLQLVREGMFEPLDTYKREFIDKDESFAEGARQGLAQLDCTSVAELKELLEEKMGYKKEDTDAYFEKLRVLVESERSNASNELSRLVKKTEKRVKDDLFGFDVDAEKKRLQAQCAEAGIEHKDWNDRNLLVLWDEETDLPQKPANDDVLMYVIDWEEELEAA